MSKPVRHTVRPGECVEAIALQYGHFPATVWDHADNAALRQLRKTGNVLLPGDVLVIPPLRERRADVASGRRHTFRRRGVPSRFRLQLEENGQPLADVPYRYEVESEPPIEGRSDAEGWVEQPLPPDAVDVLLTLYPGEPGEQRLALRMGHLDPVTSERGVRSRLFNLRYLLEVDDDADQLLLAVGLFQDAHGIAVSGDWKDAGTQAKLVEVHGS